MDDDALWETRRQAQRRFGACIAAARAARCRRCWIKAVLRRGVARARARRL
jgi:endonuclease III